MENTFDKTATETIDLLESRLRRIEHAVCGQTSETLNNKVPATVRLAQLEHKLHQLASKSRVAQELLNLYSRYPDLFQCVNPHDLPTTLDTESLLSIVMASASSYHTTASNLCAIRDVPVLPAELSAQLINLQPRIAKVEALQAVQNAELAELRERSAAVIQRWYTIDILRAGETWAEMEGKLEQVEQRVRRVSLARRMDDALV